MDPSGAQHPFSVFFPFPFALPSTDASGLAPLVQLPFFPAFPQQAPFWNMLAQPTAQPLLAAPPPEPEPATSLDSLASLALVALSQGPQQKSVAVDLDSATDSSSTRASSKAAQPRVYSVSQLPSVVESPDTWAGDDADDVDRDTACAKALMQPTLDAVYARIDADPAAHYLTKVRVWFIRLIRCLIDVPGVHEPQGCTYARNTATAASRRARVTVPEHPQQQASRARLSLPAAAARARATDWRHGAQDGVAESGEHVRLRDPSSHGARNQPDRQRMCQPTPLPLGRCQPTIGIVASSKPQ